MFPSRKDWTISLHFCVTGLTGRPNFTPLAFATLNPARVRSLISERSNSAIAIRTCMINRPAGFSSLVSIGWEVQMSATPLESNSKIICAR